jgi:hypothetical protein
MRTTIEFPDDLLREAKSRAALEGISLREFFLAAVQKKLEPSAQKVRRPPPIVGTKGGTPIPDLTTEQIDEALFG